MTVVLLCLLQELLAPGSRVEGRIGDSGPVLYRFEARSGSTYTATVELGTLRDSILTLLAADGRTVIDRNDDARGELGKGSRIEWRCTESATCLLRVQGYIDYRGTFTLGLEEARPAAAADPTDPALNSVGDLFPLRPGARWEFIATYTTLDEQSEPGEERTYRLVFRVDPAVEIARGDGGTVEAHPLRGFGATVPGMEPFLSAWRATDPVEDHRTADYVRWGSEGLEVVAVELEGGSPLALGDAQWTWLSGQVVEGRRWSVQAALGPQRVEGAYRWGGVQVVSVGGQELAARVLECEVTDAEGEGVRGRIFLAPGRGPVRFDWEIVGSHERLRCSAVLERFTRGN